MSKLRIVNFPKAEYFQQITKKNKIVLHHTVSSTAQSAIDWWQQDKGTSRVATAYIVDKDGTVFQLFEPEYWAYHIGKGSVQKDNQNAIGIEIVNEGALKKRDGKFYWFDGRYEYKGEVFELEDEWRGEKYFAKYTMEQVDSVALLVKYLIYRMKTIHSVVIDNFDYLNNWQIFNGVCFHCNLRTDKTDISPAYPIKDLQNFLLSPELVLNKDIEKISESKWQEEHVTLEEYIELAEEKIKPVENTILANAEDEEGNLKISSSDLSFLSNIEVPADSTSVKAKRKKRNDIV